MRASLFPALLLAAAAGLAAPAARAGEGASTTWLNVRSGPGAGNARVGGLAPGDVVEILRCNADAWCRIVGSGQDGWVASRYLTAGPNAPEADPRCSWELQIDRPDPQFRAVCPAGVEPPAPPPPPGDIACFYERENFGGTRTCLEVGDYATLAPGLDDTFSSVQVSGEARVRLCVDPALGGTCMDWLESAPSLDRRLDDTASSVKVYVGYLPPPPPPPPVVRSEGLVPVTLNGRVNLDLGRPGPAGADIWWRPANGDAAVIEPVNGAQLSLGDGTDRSLHDCVTESFDERPLDFAALTDGAVVCLKTNLGRVGRFQVSKVGGDTLDLAYVTWAQE
ncbi:SH3 domain-containing protein [Psychromarinibacter sp. C21-152]|uniref:SH3 domain-containing protein n=1 Tax=Psychromarinibacter sediminicola TaxID=3033385 RepID=A0AAE3NUZ9_9RHOB|nr:SH3 domain-containing protein [Psychromarinibacter sediminicola]MDF0602591.1 SH3 domain-containing protein [Psychromarinibacter sediminicola]